MTPSEIADIARRAGFQESSIPIAVAIALAESSGNPRAHNPRPPDDSYGLWQINMLGNLGPSRRARYRLRSNEDLYDPLTNARVAYGESSGGSYWRPWSTFLNGAYKRYLTSVPAPPGNTLPAVLLPPSLIAPGGLFSTQPPQWILYLAGGMVAFVILSLLWDRIKGESTRYAYS